MLEISEIQTNQTSNHGRRFRNNKLDGKRKNSGTVIFVDPAFNDYQSLVNSASEEAEVIILDPRHDSIEQITQTLAKCTGIKRLYIVCHGSPGSMQLGFGQLNLLNLSQERMISLLRQWRCAMTADAELLLYCCQVATGSIGKAFIQCLENLTGLKITASCSLPGNPANGYGGVCYYRLEHRFSQNRAYRPSISFTPSFSNSLLTEYRENKSKQDSRIRGEFNYSFPLEDWFFSDE
ncbi:MAG: DUF4347 domain-containing protein [Coleofasciculaceae cyanobacterium]